VLGKYDDLEIQKPLDAASDRVDGFHRPEMGANLDHTGGNREEITLSLFSFRPEPS
jgi:hypothetical protein